MSNTTLNSDSSPRTAKAATSPAGQWHKLLKHPTLIWLALPLTLSVGCASAPKDSPAYGDLQAAPVYTEQRAPIAEPMLTPGQAADWAISHKIYLMFMADKGINYPLWASVHNGAVSMGGTSIDRSERKRIVNGMWALAGVTEVINEQGKDVAPTIPVKAVAVR